MVQSDGNDLLLFADVQAIERLVVGQRALQIDSSEPFVPLQKFDKTVDGGDWTGDEEIEAFRCQQHGAFEAKVEAHAPEDGLQAVEVDEVDEP